MFIIIIQKKTNKNTKQIIDLSFLQIQKNKKMPETDVEQYRQLG
jgi:hypothetical protein